MQQDHTQQHHGLAQIKRALISVSNKNKLVPFAKLLSARNIEILATGGTYRLLEENNLPVTEVSSYTDFPEMMEGRVKTLHPKIHGGILARRGQDEAIMAEHAIKPIDLVIVNLYPFVETIKNGDATLANAIENIDIGGPTMIRSAAKNFKDVAIVVDPTDYEKISQALTENNNHLDLSHRFALSKKAFQHTATYDANIANYLGQIKWAEDQAYDSIPEKVAFSEVLNLTFTKEADLRYGENPHQASALYTYPEPLAHTVITSKFEQGKSLSYNNIMDADAAWECVCQFDLPACVIVKHANPCGVAIAHDALQAYLKAYETDPVSAFGGIIAFNIEIDEKTAERMIQNQFIEVIIAPAIHEKALKHFQTKPNIRVLNTAGKLIRNDRKDYRPVNGGMLVQDKDQHILKRCDLKVVSKRAPTEQEIEDLLFAWSVVKFVKSNAIVYAKDQRTIGIGAGQMSRVHSAKIAQIKGQEAMLSILGSVMASDAFFPFRDSIDAAREAGVSAIIQPGGSMRDNEVIQAADEANIAMVLTGIRHFKH